MSYKCGASKETGSVVYLCFSDVLVSQLLFIYHFLDLYLVIFVLLMCIMCYPLQLSLFMHVLLSRHRRLQAGECPDIARVILKHCVLISQGPDAKTRGVPSDQHKLAYARTDVRIAYSVVPIRFRNCASNAA